MLASRRAIAAAIAAAMVLVGLSVAASLSSARDHLNDAREAAFAGREALGAQEAGAANAAFASAGASFETAHRRLGGSVRVLEVVPVVRQNLRAARAAAEAGALVSGVGTQVAGLLDEESGGVAALAPRDGRLLLEPLGAAVAPAAEAAAAIRQAAALVNEADSPWLLGPVAAGVRDLRMQLAAVQPLADAAEALTGQLPAFLGAEGPRRYFFGAANPAELRGAGGFIGSYTILTVEDGRLSFGEFAPIQDLPTVSSDAIAPPNADYASRYNRYGGAGFWQNINMTPDYPSAATAIERLYEHGVGERLDGTIVVGPAALAPLLAVTGPTEIPGIGQVDADSIVAVMANEAFGEFESQDERKRALGAVAAGVFDRFLQGSAQTDPVAAGRALAEAATGGDLLLHAADPDVQDAFRRVGVAGQLRADEGDFLAVVGNNAAANKVDFYTDRSVSYRAAMLPGGMVRSRATVTLRNAAPVEGEPQYVIGPNVDGLQAGGNKTILGVYCAADCVLDAYSRDGEPAAASPELELGHPVFTAIVELASGDTAELAYGWTVPQGWTPTEAGGTYRLTVRGQATIRATHFDLAVEVPAGLEVVSTDPEMAVAGGELRWSGELGRSQVFDIRLQRPVQELLAETVRSRFARPLLAGASAEAVSRPSGVSGRS